MPSIVLRQLSRRRTLASLKLGLLEIDAHSPLAPYDSSAHRRSGPPLRDESSSESTSDSDEDEPLGLIRPQVKKWCAGPQDTPLMPRKRAKAVRLSSN